MASTSSSTRAPSVRPHTGLDRRVSLPASSSLPIPSTTRSLRVLSQAPLPSAASVSTSTSTMAPASAQSASATPAGAAAPNHRRLSSVQSKVGSLEHINYKPKNSEKKIPTFKSPSFSHIRARVDAKMVLPIVADIGVNVDAEAGFDHQNGSDNAPENAAQGKGAAASGVKSASAVLTAATAAARAAARAKLTAIRLSVDTASTTPSGPRGTHITSSAAKHGRTASTTSNGSSTSTTKSGPKVVVTPGIVTPTSPVHSRRGSASAASPHVASPTSPGSSAAGARRMSKHIIPTQRASYGHIRSKVGSFDNLHYATTTVIRTTSGSSGSSSSNGEGSSPHSPTEGRSRSPSVTSSSSFSVAGETSLHAEGKFMTPASRRATFKIPASKKLDYSSVRSKVGSLDLVNHRPQGGNLRIFSEKLAFRENAQSKVAKEINIVQFYQDSEHSIDQEADEVEQEQEGEGEQEQEQEQGLQQESFHAHCGNEHEQQSIVYSEPEVDEDQDLDLDPPKSILSVLDEVTETVEGLELDNTEQPEMQGHRQFWEASAAV